MQLFMNWVQFGCWFHTCVAIILNIIKLHMSVTNFNLNHQTNLLRQINDLQQEKKGSERRRFNKNVTISISKLRSFSTFYQFPRTYRTVLNIQHIMFCCQCQAIIQNIPLYKNHFQVQYRFKQKVLHWTLVWKLFAGRVNEHHKQEICIFCLYANRSSWTFSCFYGDRLASASLICS